MPDPEAPPETPPETPPVIETWHTKLPEDLRADPSLVDFKDEKEMIPMPINVARSFVNTKKLVGRDKIPMPKTDEEWAETYNRLGRPEAASQYNIAIENPDSLDPAIKDVMVKAVDWFKEISHEAGLNDKQARQLFKAYLSKSQENIAQHGASIESALRDAEVDLRTTYGNNFEGKMVLMNRGIEELDRRLDGGGLKDLVKGMELARHPTFVKAMVMVGEMMAEDLGLDKSTGGPSIDAANLDDQILTLQTSDAYIKGDHPGHSAAVDKMSKLMQIKHGRKPVDSLTRTSFIT